MTKWGGLGLAEPFDGTLVAADGQMETTINRGVTIRVFVLTFFGTGLTVHISFRYVPEFFLN